MDASDSGTHPMGGGVSRRNLLRNALLGGSAGLIAVPLDVRLAAKERHAAEADAAGTEVVKTPRLKKYVDPLPRPLTAIPDPSVYPGADYYDITMREGRWRFHRDLGLGYRVGLLGRRTRTIRTSRSAWAISGRPSA